MWSKIRSYVGRKAVGRQLTEASGLPEQSSGREPEVEGLSIDPQNEFHIPGQKFVHQNIEWLYLTNYYLIDGTEYVLGLNTVYEGASRPMVFKAKDVQWLPLQQKPMHELVNGVGSVPTNIINGENPVVGKI